jgi:WD40 repeat protein/transglutaminase-like putative cysteine protease
MRVVLGLLLIVGMAGCAKENNPPPASADSALSQYCRESVGQVAFGVYHDKQKLGWATLEFLLTENEVAPQVHSSFSLYIRTKIDNQKETLESRQENIYDLAGEGPLVRVESEEIYNGNKSISEQAVKTETGYAVDMLIEGQRRQFQTATSRDTLTEQLRVSRWLRSLPKVNDTLHLSEFSFDTLRTNSETGGLPSPDEKMTFVFLGRRLARWSGVPVTVSHVKWIYEDVEFTTEFFPDGTWFSCHVGPFELRREEFAVAKDLNLVVPNMMTHVPVKTNLGDPTTVSRLIVELRGLGDFQVPESPCQQISQSDQEKTTLTIVSGQRAKLPSKLTPEMLRKYTASTVLIQSDHPRIKKLARLIAENETDRIQIVDRLQFWVYAYLEASYSANAQTTIRVLDNRAGDCTEHALLFTALARSLGIPAREVSGLIFSDNEPGFYWHAWAEIHDGHQWVGIDPAWAETVIDAAHIRMSGEENDSKWISVVGQLDIQVVDQVKAVQDDSYPGQEMLTISGHSGGVLSGSFSPDGKRIVSGGDDESGMSGEVKVWDASTGREILTLKGHSKFVSSVGFSPDGSRIVSGSGDNTLKVWDAETGQETLTLRGHTQPVTGMTFSPDGIRIVSGSLDSVVKVWDAETGQETLTLKGHSGSVRSVSFSPDGIRIVSGSLDNEVKVWDAETGQETLTLKGHSGSVWSVSFSPDGNRIVSGSLDSEVKVWDAETGQETLTLKGHSGSVWGVSFSPDGRRIVSGSLDGTVKVWDAETGQETLTLKGHSGGVTSVSFSPDGNQIFSGGLDGTVKVWDARTQGFEENLQK